MNYCDMRGLIWPVLFCVFVIICPIVGVLFAASGLIKSFIYLFLSCDDDEDFRLLLLNLFKRNY